jgi:hypothetical protein
MRIVSGPVIVVDVLVEKPGPVVVFAFEVSLVSSLDGDNVSSGAVVMDVVVGESKGRSSFVAVLFKAPGFVVVVIFAFEVVSLLDGGSDSSGAIVTDVVARDSNGGSLLTRTARVAVGGTSQAPQTNSESRATFMISDCGVLSDVNCSLMYSVATRSFSLSVNRMVWSKYAHNSSIQFPFFVQMGRSTLWLHPSAEMRNDVEYSIVY